MNEKPLLVSTETPEFVSWLAGATKLHVDYMATNFPNNPKEAITHNNGKRYIRVMRGNSAHAFIDRVNGDVLKPATWSAPAKGARGNIFDTSNGLAHMSVYGPVEGRLDWLPDTGEVYRSNGVGLSVGMIKGML